MAEPNAGIPGERLAEPRNTRDVVALRLSGREREQITRASERRNIALSAFIREAALAAASAIVAGRVHVRGSDKLTPAEPARETVPVVTMVDEPRPEPYYVVDGERVPMDRSPR